MERKRQKDPQGTDDGEVFRGTCYEEHDHHAPYGVHRTSRQTSAVGRPSSASDLGRCTERWDLSLGPNASAGLHEIVVSVVKVRPRKEEKKADHHRYGKAKDKKNKTRLAAKKVNKTHRDHRIAAVTGNRVNR